MAEIASPTSRPRMMAATQTTRREIGQLQRTRRLTSVLFKHTRECPLDGQTHCQDSHERFVRHRINNCADNRLQIPSSSNPPIQQICDARISENADRPGMVIVKHEISHHRRGNQSGKGQEVGDVVDVLVQDGFASDLGVFGRGR